MAEIMWGLSESKWKELKEQQREYNFRKSKIIQKLEEKIKHDNDTPQDKEASKPTQA